MNPDPDRLSAIPLFADLTSDELAEVASWLSIEEASEGRRLTPEGASGYLFYVIEAGSAEVHHHDEVVGVLGPGDFFGEMAIMGEGRRVADVIATSPMTLFAMFGTSFREMETRLPRIAERIRGTLEERRALL